ncbi:MAG: toxin-antitoxin system HicB family antitoxin [Candidatus Latescibacterota bacterium]
MQTPGRAASTAAAPHRARTLPLGPPARAQAAVRGPRRSGQWSRMSTWKPAWRDGGRPVARGGARSIPGQHFVDHVGRAQARSGRRRGAGRLTARRWCQVLPHLPRGAVRGGAGDSLPRGSGRLPAPGTQARRETSRPFSGRTNVRVDGDLHRRLHGKAQRRGVSLFVVDVPSGVVEWTVSGACCWRSTTGPTVAWRAGKTHPPLRLACRQRLEAWGGMHLLRHTAAQS